MASVCCLLILLVAGLTSTAFAADGSPFPGGLTLEQARMMDADKDGRISKAEYRRQSEDMTAWSELDANDDGFLDQDEQRQSIRPAPFVRFN